MTEFNKHHCSEALKLFVDVEGALAGGGEKVYPYLSLFIIIIIIIVITDFKFIYLAFC